MSNVSQYGMDCFKKTNHQEFENTGNHIRSIYEE